MYPFAGAHCVGCDRHAFNYTLRIAFQNAAIHECARVALVAVADHVLHVAGCFGNRAPLQSARIPAAAASAQAACCDLVDDAIRCHVSQGGHQCPVSIAGNIIVDLLRIDLAGILEHHVDLLIEVLAKIALQRSHRLAAKTVHDCFGIALP